MLFFCFPRCDPIQRLKNVFPCPTCGLELASATNLRRHRARCDGIRRRAEEAKRDRDDPQMYACDKCAKVAKSHTPNTGVVPVLFFLTCD